MPRETGRKVVATNRKARHDYHVEDVYEAGIVLTGTEVKSLRAGRASLVDGFASVSGGEVWLEGVHIPEYSQGTWTNHAPRRKRKLLLHRTEIDRLAATTREKGLTLVPCRSTSRTAERRSSSRSPGASGSTTSARLCGSGRTAVRPSGRCRCAPTADPRGVAPARP